MYIFVPLRLRFQIRLNCTALLICWWILVCCSFCAADAQCCAHTFGCIYAVVQPHAHQQDSNVESFLCILGSYWHWYFADEVDEHNEHHCVCPTPQQNLNVNSFPQCKENLQHCYLADESGVHYRIDAVQTCAHSIERLQHRRNNTPRFISKLAMLYD